MPFENGQQGKDKQNPEQLRHVTGEGEATDKVAMANPATAPQATTAAASEETEEPDPQEAEQVLQRYYAEASVTKKITVFVLTTILVLIALGLIYAYWPLGTMPLKNIAR